MQDKYAAQGFIIIAAHCQDVPRDKVVALCRSKHVNYTVTSGTRLPGDTSNGIPHAFLFGADGKLIKEGHPESLTKDIDDAIAKAPHWITGGRQLASKEGKAIADGLKAGKPWSWALTECESALKKNDEKAKEEADFLKAQILALGDRKLTDAGSAEATDPVTAMGLYTEVSTGWKKTDQGGKADAKIKELKADKNFQEELKVGQTIQKIRALADSLVLPEGKETYDLTAGPNAQVSPQIQAGAKDLKKKHPDSPQVKKLLDDLKTFGFNIP